MSLAEFQTAVREAESAGEPLEALAYVVLLWHTGVRKSEAYERLTEDVSVESDFVIVDFHKRKKHGEEVPALKIPRAFFGVEYYLLAWIESARLMKPCKKQLFYQLETEKTRTTAKGNTVTVKQRISKTVKARWLFPNIGSTRSWELVKRVLGENYYPHYLRLRKLSSIGKNPKTRSLVHIKAVSGLKSVRAIEAYLGFDEETQDEAMMGSE